MTPLKGIYRRLFKAFGPQCWWPADSSYEMMLGAILTQATSWHNVERAIAQLKTTTMLSPRGIAVLSRGQLERAIRSAGYFRQKAERVRMFSHWYLSQYRGQAKRMFRVPWPVLRKELLRLKGIGPETADAILLYAGNKPVFVVDAYTIRIFRRHYRIRSNATYAQVQKLAMHELPEDAALYNEFHALIVAVGKQYCHRRNPNCDHCPLGMLPHTREVIDVKR